MKKSEEKKMKKKLSSSNSIEKKMETAEQHIKRVFHQPEVKEQLRTLMSREFFKAYFQEEPYPRKKKKRGTSHE